MTLRRTFATLLVSGVSALALAGLTAGTAAAADPVATIPDLTGQSSSVRLDSGFTDALTQLEVTPGTIGDATLADGSAVRLTPTEWHVLEVLVRNQGKLVEQRTLLQEVWGPAYETETNYLRVYLAQLRRKLEPDPAHPRHLLTEPGLGYRFVS